MQYANLKYTTHPDNGQHLICTPSGDMIARADNQADAEHIIKALNTPHPAPLLTALTDFVVMAENNHTTGGQWAALVRDGRSLINSARQPTTEPSMQECKATIALHLQIPVEDDASSFIIAKLQAFADDILSPVEITELQEEAELYGNKE